MKIIENIDEENPNNQNKGKKDSELEVLNYLFAKKYLFNIFGYLVTVIWILFVTWYLEFEIF